MDLIDKITTIIKGLELKAPIIDIHFDNQQNIVGHIASETFKTISDEEAQKIIWNALKKNMDTPELIRVISIFHETPQDRLERLHGYRTKEIKHSKYWVHETPELAKYWLFIDIAKFGDEFKSFFLIINEKHEINQGLTFVYNKEVLEFMELDQDEIYNELYSNTFGNGEADIKMDLMNLYEKLTSQQLFGKANMYWYVYEDFQLVPVSRSQLIFTEKEIKMLQEGLKKLDDFGIKKELESAMKKSELINSMKKKIN